MLSKGKTMCSALSVVLLAVLLLSTVTEAKLIFVGNQAGWTNYDLSSYKVPNYGAWAISQRAVVGDRVVFKYARGLHNVNLLPSLAAFQSCDFSRAKLLDNGESGMYSWLATSPGEYYFGCNKQVEAEGNHCGSGQKFSLTVRAARSSNEAGDGEAEFAISEAETPGSPLAPISAPPAITPVAAAPISSPPTAPPAMSPVSVAPSVSSPTTPPVSSPVASAPSSPPPSVPPVSTPSASAPATPPPLTPPASSPSSSPPPTISSPAPTTTSPPPITTSPPPPSPVTSPAPTTTTPPPSTVPQSSPPSSAPVSSPVSSSPVSSPGSSVPVPSPPSPPLSSGTTPGSPSPATSGSSNFGSLLTAAVLWGYLIAVAVMAVMHY